MSWSFPQRKPESRLVRHLAVEELQSILDRAVTNRSGTASATAPCYTCVSRQHCASSELLACDSMTWNSQPQASVLVHGKGRKAAVPAIVEETTAALEPRLAVSPRDRTGARTIRQCPRSGDNPRGLRSTFFTNMSETAQGRCPSLADKTGVPTCAASHLRRS